MPRSMILQKTGGPEVLEWTETPTPRPGPGELRLRHTAVGVNYIDIYFRKGSYPLPSLPASVGMEAAGVIEELGPDVAGFRPGQRVAYVSSKPGAYSEARTLPAAEVVALPDDIPDNTAAAIMLKGMTAEYLLHRTHAVKSGDTILVHAAAGGTGLLLCQWGSALGARVLGTVSTDEKAALAKANGCAETILYSREDFVARVKELTQGRGCQVVYDGVGKDTLHRSVECLDTFGHLVSFGQASGAIPPFEVSSLGPKSASLTRPKLFDYIAKRPWLDEIATRLFDALRQGHIKIEQPRLYPLKEAARAHQDLESRATTGSLVLTV